jgi:hypothetical protein
MCVKVCRRVTRNHPLMPLRFHTAETLAPHVATEPWEFSVTPLGTVSNTFGILGPGRSPPSVLNVLWGRPDAHLAVPNPLRVSIICMVPSGAQMNAVVPVFIRREWQRWASARRSPQGALEEVTWIVSWLGSWRIAQRAPPSTVR